MSPTFIVEGFEIREAREADVPLVMQFIRELAEYEKLAHEVKAAEADLRRTLFGDKPGAEVLIGEFRGEPVAFALFFHNYSTFLAKPGLYLEDLFVRPSARGHGLGQAMLAHLARLALERGCGRFEWWCLDWNKSAIGFYEKLGAEPMSDWTVYRMTGKALEKLGS
jgi:GNAT superfamily N-acetyltransferase